MKIINTCVIVLSASILSWPLYGDRLLASAGIQSGVVSAASVTPTPSPSHTPGTVATLDSAFVPPLINSITAPLPTVKAVLHQAPNKVIIAGNFTTVGGNTRYGIARLNIDGTFDPSFSSPLTFVDSLDGIETAVFQSDGKILVGGSFMIGGTRYAVARLNSNGTPDASFSTPQFEFGTTRAIAIQPDGKIIIGGPLNFGQTPPPQQLPRRDLIRLNSDGTLDTSFQLTGWTQNVSFGPDSIVLMPDGKIVGGFGGDLGVGGYQIVRVTSSGAFDPAYGQNILGYVNKLILQPDGKLLAGGDGISINGEAGRTVVRLNPDGTKDPTFDLVIPNAIFANATALELEPDGNLLIGGNFYFEEIPRTIMRIFPDGVIDGGFGVHFSSGPIYGIDVQPDNKILVGGPFQIFDSPTPNRDRVARLNVGPPQDCNARPIPKNDSDGDGLWDCWETYGIDSDDSPTSDKSIDLHLEAQPYNANPLRKDIFVEIDYMTAPGHSDAPRNGVLSAVVDAFANAPVNNPDGSRGITLHAMLDDALPHFDDINFDIDGVVCGTFTSFDYLKNQYQINNQQGWFTTVADRQSQNFANIRNAKLLAFRYAIFAHKLSNMYGPKTVGCVPSTSSGIARAAPSADFIVSIAHFSDFTKYKPDSCSPDEFAAVCGRRAAESGSFMHELGHALGLKHGGGDIQNCKPNYLSVMSYSLQFPSYVPNRPLDYSRNTLPNLDENNLNEQNGVQSPEVRDTIYGVPSPTPSPSPGGFRWYPRKVPTNQPIDWDYSCQGNK